jgi:hypothetical protein
MLIIPAVRRWRQEHLEFKTSLDYLERSCLKKKLFAVSFNEEYSSFFWQNHPPVFCGKAK